MDGRGEFGEVLVYVPAARDQARLVRADMGQRAESVHLQFEDIVVVVERLGTPDQLSWFELREGQSDFSVAVQSRQATFRIQASNPAGEVSIYSSIL